VSQRQASAIGFAPAEPAPYTDEPEAGRNPLKIGALVALVVLTLAYPFVFSLPYQQHLAILVCLYALMAVGWNILGGYTGQVSLGNTIFFGVGAYTSTVLLKTFLISPWVGMLVGVLLSILLAVVVGYPCFRLKGHYFAIATIAVGEIMHTVAVNTQELGAAVGLQQPILPESWVNFQFHGTDKVPYYFIILAFLALAQLVVYKLERSKMGYYFRAIKEDPVGSREI
jgi:branched-chain amino acid transport system permease protein